MIGTHGRSIFKSNLDFIHSLNLEVLEKSIHLFEIKPIKFSKRWGSKRTSWSETYKPEYKFAIWSKFQGKYTISVSSKKGILIYEKDIILDAGFNEYEYGLSINKNLKKKNNDFYLGEDGIY